MPKGSIHISAKGEPAPCTAQIACRLGLDAPHFETMEDAYAYLEARNIENFGQLGGVAKKNGELLVLGGADRAVTDSTRGMFRPPFPDDRRLSGIEAHELLTNKEFNARLYAQTASAKEWFKDNAIEIDENTVLATRKIAYMDGSEVMEVSYQTKEGRIPLVTYTVDKDGKRLDRGMKVIDITELGRTGKVTQVESMSGGDPRFTAKAAKNTRNAYLSRLTEGARMRADANVRAAQLEWLKKHKVKAFLMRAKVYAKAVLPSQGLKSVGRAIRDALATTSTGRMRYSGSQTHFNRDGSYAGTTRHYTTVSYYTDKDRQRLARVNQKNEERGRAKIALLADEMENIGLPGHQSLFRRSKDSA